MKILILGDVHWSCYSSIVRKRDKKYSVRLQNLINSLNWVQEQSKENNCEALICLGDFFDKCDLNSEEITALLDVKWNHDIDQYYIVGNHESPIATLEYNSTNALESLGFKVISKVSDADIGNKKFVFLPYIKEENRKTITEYKKELSISNNDIVVCSHNDLKDVQYGGFLSKEGFSIDDITKNCKYYFNGHLHNSAFIINDDRCKLFNVGNITGQNFTEDANIYDHHICIYDTIDNSIKVIENPYAMNFYKIEIESENQINNLYNLKNNAVVTIKCNENYIERVKQIVSELHNIIEYRIIVTYNKVDIDVINSVQLNDVNHLEQFNNFILDTLGNTDIVRMELTKITGGSK